MLERKNPHEVFHTLARVHALSGNAFCEACDCFLKEMNESNLNIDEKVIMASFLLNINLAATCRNRKEELESKQEIIRNFYFANYDNCAPGTKDYIKNYEEKMAKEKEMFKDLHSYINNEFTYQKKLKKSKK